MAKTLYDKIWDAHLVEARPGETPLIYIDRHLIHEVTSPQAFEGLRNTGRKVRRPELTLAVADHNVPTKDRDQGITDPESREQVAALAQNTKDFGIEYFAMDDIRAGIVHIIGPEQGWTLPGTTIVCGDSHTSTHGAFGALAFGIGTSDVEHVLATQTLLMPKSQEHARDGERQIARWRHRQGYRPGRDRQHRHRRRHRLCHRICRRGGAGAVHGRAHDPVQSHHRRRRPRRPDCDGRDHHRLYQGPSPRAQGRHFEAAVHYWRTLKSDPDAEFDAEITLDARDIVPMVTWGTSPEQALPVTGNVPDPGPDGRA